MVTGRKAGPIEDHSKLGSVETVASVAIPVGVYLLLIFALYFMLLRSLDSFRIVLAAVSLGLLTGASRWLQPAWIWPSAC